MFRGAGVTLAPLPQTGREHGSVSQPSAPQEGPLPAVAVKEHFPQPPSFRLREVGDEQEISDQHCVDYALGRMWRDIFLRFREKACDLVASSRV